MYHHSTPYTQIFCFYIEILHFSIVYTSANASYPMMKIIENMVGQTSASVMPVPFHRHKSPRSVPSPRINLRKTPFYDTSVEDNMIFTIPCCMYRCILCHKQTPLLFISGQISLDITKEFFFRKALRPLEPRAPRMVLPLKKRIVFMKTIRFCAYSLCY